MQHSCCQIIIYLSIYLSIYLHQATHWETSAEKVPKDSANVHMQNVQIIT